MKSKLCALTNLLRALSRPNAPLRTISSNANCSTECLTEEPDRPDHCVDVLKTWGCSDADASTVLARNPGLKKLNPAELESKLAQLSALGLNPRELVKIVNCRPRFLSDRRNACFNDQLGFFASLFDSPEALAKAIVRNPSCLLYDDFHAKVEPVARAYERLGLSKPELAAMLAHRPTLIHRTSLGDEKIDYIRRTGVNRDSKLYKYVVTLIGVTRVETIRAKVANLERFGLSEDEVLELFGRAPLLLTASVEKVERQMRFVLGTMRLSAEAVVRHPDLLMGNLKGVLRPRVLLLQKMRESGLVEGTGERFLMRALRMTEGRFVKAFLASQPDNLRADFAGFYAKAKEMRGLAMASNKSKGRFPF